MDEHHDERLPGELEPIAARLRAERAHADAVRLDELKRRVITRCQSQPGRSILKSRIATILTILGIVGGTGGAIAIAHGTSSKGPLGGAANGQYCGPQQNDPDVTGDIHSNCHTGSKFRGAGGEDRPSNPDKPSH